jgi:hypothetical protein
VSFCSGGDITEDAKFENLIAEDRGNPDDRLRSRRAAVAPKWS